MRPVHGVGLLALLLASSVPAYGPPPAPAAEAGIDLLAHRDAVYLRAIDPNYEGCLSCATGSLLVLDTKGAEGAPEEPLEPGAYFFAAAVPGEHCALEAAPVVLTPRDGTWSMPTFVWRDHRTIGGFPEFDDYTGRTGPIALPTICHHGMVETRDELVLFHGNFQEPLEARLDVEVDGRPLGDVDGFAPWDGFRLV